MFDQVMQKMHSSGISGPGAKAVEALIHADIFKTQQNDIVLSPVSGRPNQYAGYMYIKDRQGRIRSLRECIDMQYTSQGKWGNTGPQSCPIEDKWLMSVILEPEAIAGMRCYYAVRKVLSVKIRSQSQSYLYKAHGYEGLYHPAIIDEPYYYQSELI